MEWLSAVRRAYHDTVVDEWSPRRWVRARIGGLVFLGFLSRPIQDALHAAWPTGRIVAVVATVVVFGLCFATVIWRNTPVMHANRAPWAVAGAAITGVPLVAVFGLSWLSVLSYFVPSMLLFNCRANRWPFIVLGIPVLDLLAGWLLLPDPIVRIVAVAVQVLLIAAVQAAFFQQISAKIELRRARAELARLAVSEERLRIARDLHDILGHRLSAVSLKAELAARLTDRDPGRAAAEMLEVATVAREALAEVRTTVSGYRRMSLAGEIETARALLCAAGVELSSSVRALPAALDECAGWVVREAVTNVVRHAAAGQCVIRASSDEGRFTIEIKDDGGTSDAGLAYGNGLTGLSERVAHAGGVLRTRRDGGWFVVTAAFGRPVAPRATTLRLAAR